MADLETKKIKTIWTGQQLKESESFIFSLYEIYQTSFAKNYFRLWCGKKFFPFFQEDKDYFYDKNFNKKQFKKHLRVWITLPTAIYVCGILSTNESKEEYNSILKLFNESIQNRNGFVITM